MSTETLQKSKKRKSYADILEEIDKEQRITAIVRVPQLCEALRDEWTEQGKEFDNQDIKDRVMEDAGKYWAESHIRGSYPSWIIDEVKSRYAKKRWEKKNEDEMKQATETVAKISRIDISEQRFIQTDDENDENDEGEATGETLTESYGGRKETLLTLYANIKEPCHDLFKALTGKEIPGMYDDLILDYIKPSRDFRRGILEDVDSSMRSALDVILAAVIEAAEDTRKIIAQIETQEAKK